MKFEVELSDKSLNDIEKIEKSGDKSLLKKIHSLINELENHPRTGTGKPEQLKHYDVPTWSRRISAKHRPIYEIHDDRIVVLVLSAYGHYSDK